MVVSAWGMREGAGEISVLFDVNPNHEFRITRRIFKDEDFKI